MLTVGYLLHDTSKGTAGKIHFFRSNAEIREGLLEDGSEYIYTHLSFKSVVLRRQAGTSYPNIIKFKNTIATNKCALYV